MSTPKSVTKINTKGVTYTSSVDKCQYYLFELSRAALRDVGKYVARKFRDMYYSKFNRITGSAGKATKYKVISGKNTLYPRVEVGLPRAHKKNTVEGFYAYFQEFGSSHTPKLGLLQRAVNENIPEIIKIESQYLSALEDEATALALVNEADMEGDAEEDEN